MRTLLFLSLLPLAAFGATRPGPVQYQFDTLLVTPTNFFASNSAAIASAAATGGLTNGLASTNYAAETATNVSAYQVLLATNAMAAALTNKYLALSDTNAIAAAGTNVAAYQAYLATNGWPWGTGGGIDGTNDPLSGVALYDSNHVFGTLNLAGPVHGTNGAGTAGYQLTSDGASVYWDLAGGTGGSITASDATNISAYQAFIATNDLAVALTNKYLALSDTNAYGAGLLSAATGHVTLVASQVTNHADALSNDATNEAARVSQLATNQHAIAASNLFLQLTDTNAYGAGLLATATNHVTLATNGLATTNYAASTATNAAAYQALIATNQLAISDSNLYATLYLMTNYVQQMVASVGWHVYSTGVTNTDSFSESGGDTRTNCWQGHDQTTTAVTTNTVASATDNAYVRHMVSTNTFSQVGN